jgi:hypothetical protein
MAPKKKAPAAIDEPAVADASTSEDEKPRRLAPIEGASVADPLAPVPHVESKQDVALIVPKTAGAYGGREDGKQVIHQVSPREEGEPGGIVMVHPAHVASFLRNVEGSKRLHPQGMGAEMEALEAGRPQGRITLAPLTDEEVEAATEMAKLGAGDRALEARQLAEQEEAAPANPSGKPAAPKSGKPKSPAPKK